jgi:transcription-repair coupling factor (superfamily II helicase)
LRLALPRDEDLLDLLAREYKGVPVLHWRIEHFQGPAAGIDLVIATNIIENGLNVPGANPVLVWRADRFGLTQLYQLLGKVRGAVRAPSVTF